MASDHRRAHDPEDKRSSSRPGRAESPVHRALKRGRSGYGAESVRPHLRDQLVLKDLLRPSYPPADRHTNANIDKSNETDG